MNIWDFFEIEALRVNFTTEWVWFRLNTRDGPFEGTEAIQHGDDPVPVELSDGDHTLHLAHREDGTYIDKISRQRMSNSTRMKPIRKPLLKRKTN